MATTLCKVIQWGKGDDTGGERWRYGGGEGDDTGGKGDDTERGKVDICISLVVGGGFEFSLILWIKKATEKIETKKELRFN